MQFVHTPEEVIRIMELEVANAKSYASYLDTDEDMIFARGFAMGVQSAIDHATGKKKV